MIAVSIAVATSTECPVLWWSQIFLMLAPVADKGLAHCNPVLLESLNRMMPLTCLSLASGGGEGGKLK